MFPLRINPYDFNFLFIVTIDVRSRVVVSVVISLTATVGLIVYLIKCLMNYSLLKPTALFSFLISLLQDWYHLDHQEDFVMTSGDVCVYLINKHSMLLQRYLAKV